MMSVAVLVLVLVPIHAFISTWGGTAIGPLLLWKAWKEVLLAVLVPLVVSFCILRPDIAKTIWQRKANQLISLYVLLHVILSLSSTASTEAVIAGLMMNLRFFAIFVLVQVIAEGVPAKLGRFKDFAVTFLLWVAVGLGVLAILQVFVLPKDFLVSFGYNKDSTIAPYLLVDQQPDALRAFATMRGPNTLGEYLLLPIAIAVYTLYKNKRAWLAWIALSLGLIAEFLTGSRSAWIGLVVAIAMLGGTILPRVHFVRWLKLGIVPIVLLLALVGWAAVNVPQVRLAIFHSQPSDSSLIEGSTEKHWQATWEGVQDVVRHPWGSGPGSAGPASFYNNSNPKLSENYYVQIAQEVGWIGLGLFVAICTLVVTRIVRRGGLLPSALVASFAGLTIINIFLHGWADDPTALTWWALAGFFMRERLAQNIPKEPSEA